MPPSKGLRRQWVVTVYDNDTGEHVTGPRIVFGRSATEAANLVGIWLDWEGFEIEARMEVGPHVPT